MLIDQQRAQQGRCLGDGFESRWLGPEGVETLTLRGLPFSLVSPEIGIAMRQSRGGRHGTPRRVQEQLADKVLPKLEVTVHRGKQHNQPPSTGDAARSAFSIEGVEFSVARLLLPGTGTEATIVVGEMVLTGDTPVRAPAGSSSSGPQSRTSTTSRMLALTYAFRSSRT